MLRRTSHLFLEVVIALVVVFVVAAAAGLWRLSQGPVSVAFLTPYFQDMLQPLPSVRIDLRDTILKWSGWRRPIDIRAVAVTATGRDGRLIAAVPEISVRLSFRALLQGKFAPTRLTAIRPDIRLKRLKSGVFQLAIGAASSEVEAHLTAILDSFLAPSRKDAPLRYLRWIDVTDGALSVDDRHLGISWGAPRIEFALNRAPTGITVDFELDADLGNQTPRLQGVAAYGAERGKIDIDLNVDQLWPSRLAARASALGRLKNADLPLSGSAQMTVGLDGAVEAGTFHVVGGAGRIDVPGVLRSPLDVKSLRALLALKPSPERFVLEDLEADFGGPRLTARAVMTVVDGVASINGDLAFSDLPIEEVRRNWPLGVAENARDWVSRNITRGTVKSARIDILSQARLDRNEFQVSSFSGDMLVEGLSVHYFRPLREVTGVRARAHFGPEFMEFRIRNGELAGLRVGGGTVRISGLATGTEVLDVDLALNGPLRDALLTLDHPRLGYVQAMAIDPRSIGGETATRLSVKLPLLNDLPIERVALRARSVLTHVSVPGVVLGRDLTEGTLDLDLDLSGMTLAGSARIGDVPSEVSTQRWFRGIGPYVARSTLAAIVSDSSLRRFGLDFRPFVAGGAKWNIELTERRDGSTVVSGVVGLDETVLALPFLNWSKPTGAPGKAEFLLTSVIANRLTLERLNVTGRDFDLFGNARFVADPEWSFAGGRIDRLRVGATRLGATLKRATRGGAMSVSVDGEVLDAAPIVSGQTSEDAGARTSAGESAAKSETTRENASSGPVDLTVALGRVELGKGRSLSTVSGRGRFDGSRWQALDLSTRLGEGRGASISIGAREGEQFIRVRSNDAGELLRRLKVVESIRGGRLSIDGIRRVSAVPTPWKGRALIEGFYALRAPALARALTLASLDGINNTLGGRGIKFTRVDIPFTFMDEVIEVRNARSVGSQLGLTGDGTLNLENNTIDFKGTIVPAYTLNTLLSHIPVIREIFTGSSKSGSGVFAVNYAVRGEMDNPSTTVNPLSVLTPGFLRSLVDVLTSGEPATDVPPEDLPQD